MIIAIRSEADSRLLVYPLIKCLYNFGTIAVFTSNHCIGRLIDNEYDGGFKNVRIVMVEDGDLQSAFTADDYYKDKYDFLILDNVGAIEYDLTIAVITNHITDDYAEAMYALMDEPTTKILKFGKPAPTIKEKTNKPSSKPNKTKKAVDEEEEEQVGIDETKVSTVSDKEPEGEFNKWHDNRSDKEKLRDYLNRKEVKWNKFPSWETIEEMEARHHMLTPDDGIIKEIHRLFEPYLNVDLRMFMKGVRQPDESSSIISGIDVR